MKRQFIFGEGQNLTISESGEVNTFQVSVGNGDRESIVYLTKEDAREISRLLASSYNQYGESVRFREPDDDLLADVLEKESEQV